MKAQTNCPQCSREFILDVTEDVEVCDVVCPHCKHEFIIRRACYKVSETVTDCRWEEYGEPRKTILSSLRPHTNKPMTASFLLLSACVFGIFNAAVLLSSDHVYIPIINVNLELLTNIFSIYGLIIVLLVFSVFSFIGFMMTVQRRKYRLSLLCAVLGIFSIGFFVGTLASIAALVLIMLARDEFENGMSGKIF